MRCVLLLAVATAEEQLPRGTEQQCDTVEEAKHLFSAGEAAFEGQDLDEAIVKWRRLAQLAPNFEQLHVADHKRAMALAMRGRAEEAMWTFRRAIDTEERLAARKGAGGNPEWREHVMSAVKQAAAFYVNAAKMQPRDIGAQINACVAAQSMGDLEGAVKLLKAAGELQPENVQLKRHMGQLLASSKPQEAIPLLRAAVHVEPQQAQAYTLLARLTCQDGESDVCARAWVDAFGSAASVTPSPDVKLLHETAAAAGKVLYGLHRDEEAVVVGERAVALGGLIHPLQMPRELVRGLSAMAWRDDARTWRSVQRLEENAHIIQQEVLGLHRKNLLLKAAVTDSESLTEVGLWKELNFIFQGTWVKQTMDLLPKTFAIITSLPEASSMVIGASKVSVIEPGTRVWPHTGLTNARLRIHLGLAGLANAKVKVGGEWRDWQEGKCIVFDDSFVHEVQHNGTETRIVLIVDVWHVDMDETQRREALLASEQRDQFVEAYKRNFAHFGKDNWF